MSLMLICEELSIWELVLYLLFHKTLIHFETGLILMALGIFSGIQLIAIGVIGEYIGNIYHEVKDQPPYVILEILERDE